MSSIKLIEIIQKKPDQSTLAVLYALLAERKPHQNISHKKLPAYSDHENFVRSEPYAHWYLIIRDVEEAQEVIGAIYLTRLREIGVSIFQQFCRNGYGKLAVRQLMLKHPGNFFANVAPTNFESISCFEDIGFKRIQVTYAYE